MTDTITTDELSAYPGVDASPEAVALVAGLINGLVDELLEDHGPTVAKPAKVKQLALAAAVRPLTNPLGATTMSVQIDDYKETVVLPDGSVVKGDSGIGFTPTEMGKLVAAITGRQPSRQSIRLVVPGYTDCPTDVYTGWLPS